MKLDFEAIGTRWEIDFEDVGSLGLEKLIRDRIEVFDKNYSRFRDDSLVNRMAQGAGRYKLPEDGKAIMDLYEQLYRVSGGCLTPLIGQMLVDAGYDASYSLRPKSEIAEIREWDEVLVYDFPWLEVKEPVLIDLGALGKGYLIDIIGELLESLGISEYVIDAGGDMRNRGKKILKVGLEHPGDFSKVIGVMELDSGKSMCASSGSRRKWGEFHHIFNPFTGASATSVLASWVVASSTLLADGLATTLFLVEPEKVVGMFDFEYLVLRRDMSVVRSDGFDAKLFLG